MDTAGKNMKRLQEYIKNQFKEDKEAEQLIWIFIKVFSSIDYIVKL